MVSKLKLWLYCVKCPQYSIWLEAPGYLYTIAVYFLHSTWLVSRDSIVDRHWMPTTDCCDRYLPCCQPASDVAENFGVCFLYRVYKPGHDFELIPTAKMETGHPVEGSLILVMNFRRSIIIAQLWRPEIARR